jgi:hypothetical protein
MFALYNVAKRIQPAKGKWLLLSSFSHFTFDIIPSSKEVIAQSRETYGMRQS